MMIARPPRSPLFPYTTLFRSSDGGDLLLPGHFVSVILWERGANEAALGGLGLQRRMRFVAHETIQREQRKNKRERKSYANREPRKTNRLEGRTPLGLPSAGLLLTRAKQQLLDSDCAGGKQDGISRSGVVVLAVGNKKESEGDEKRPAERAE